MMSMRKDVREQLIQFLEELLKSADNGLGGIDLRTGICHNIVIGMSNRGFNSTIVYDTSRKLRELWFEWPEHSGDDKYPISGQLTYQLASLSRSLWKGEQLEKRKNLLKFTIAELKDGYSV